MDRMAEHAPGRGCGAGGEVDEFERLEHPEPDDHAAIDAWRKVDAAVLVRLLATHYGDVGWWVERVVGELAQQNSADLRLRRDFQSVLVQCAHWNAPSVGLREVRDLIAAMSHDGASGAALVCAGEFEPAAVEVAHRAHVQLIGLGALLDMIGPPPEASAASAAEQRADSGNTAARLWTAWLIWALTIICLVGLVFALRTIFDRSAATSDPLEEARAASML